MKIKKFTEPPFWDDFIDSEPLCQSFIQNYDEIKKECFRLNKYLGFLFIQYPVLKLNIRGFKSYFIDYTTKWRLAPFFGGRYDGNVNKRATELQLIKLDIEAFLVRLFCPKIYSLMKDYFDKKIILNAVFAKLNPGSEIKAHIHPVKDGVHRMNIHLGIFCDPDCKITVGEETRVWEEGKLLAFKNTGPYRHSVVHNGTKDRIILFVEVDAKYLEKYGVFRGERIKD
jgi:hypothetical protein